MILTAHLTTVLLPGVVLDWLLGDPHWMPHPVRWMGRSIAWLEGVLRRVLPRTPAGERLAGTLLAILIPVVFGGGSWFLLEGLRGMSSQLAWMVEVWFTYQLLAARALQKESMAVCPPLAAGDLEGARDAVSRIVGRDTQQLDEAGVVKAAVETVAENTSDGVIAPLLFLALGGLPLGMVYKAVNTMDSMVGYRNERYRWFGTAAARLGVIAPLLFLALGGLPLGMVYKAVNTMDSMVGYRNERYRWFGTAAARLDDVLNWIPARLSGLLMCLAAALLPGCSGRRALRVFFRDRKKHSSPNSAHTEAACAGALGVRLAGDAWYFGKKVSKPTIGDNLRPVEQADVARACRLMYVTELLTLAMVLGGGILLSA